MTDNNGSGIDGPPKWRVSDEDIAGNVSSFDEDDAFEEGAIWELSADLRDARAYIERCSDYAATLGIENDELRKERDELKQGSTELSADFLLSFGILRAAMEEARQHHMCTGSVYNILTKALESGGGTGKTLKRVEDQHE